MPSTANLGPDANSYESFKTMSEPTKLVANTNGVTEPKIIPNDVNDNTVKSNSSSPIEDKLAELKNPIVPVKDAEELDVLIKMERANK